MKRIYVAGASKEAVFVEHCITELRAAGWVITEDWCAALRTQRAPEHELTAAEAEEIAVACLRGVITADVFWLLAPSAPSVGAWVELGYARNERECRVPYEIIVSGACPSVFAALADARYPSHLEALHHLKERACGPG